MNKHSVKKLNSEHKKSHERKKTIPLKNQRHLLEKLTSTLVPLTLSLCYLDLTLKSNPQEAKLTNKFEKFFFTDQSFCVTLVFVMNVSQDINWYLFLVAVPSGLSKREWEPVYTIYYDWEQIVTADGKTKQSLH